MLSSQILSTEVREVISGNTIHNTYLPIWQDYLTSYMGGEDYRRASNLTRYQLESDKEYAQRIRSTPLENHCRSVISVYVSFLFREHPDRELGSLDGLPEVESLMEDADYDGRCLDHFMKECSIWSSVYGHCWVLVSKPNTGAQTLADERAVGVRPYLSIINPIAVLDWHYSRDSVGKYKLDLLKYVEDVNGNLKTVKIWQNTDIRTIIVDESKDMIVSDLVEPNQLGKIPAVTVYSTRSPVRGLGISDIADIAMCQKFIYNALSEIDQSIKLDSHPSLVATTEVQVGTGAGALITMPDNMDPSLKPYVLDFQGANVSNILAVINHMTEVIDKSANTGAIRTTETRTASGVAIQTEFELLNARLSEKADNLELAEEQIWELVAEYLMTSWDGEILYPDSFNIRDDANELTKLEQARRIATDPNILKAIDAKLIEILDIEELEYEEHPTTTPEDRTPHIQQMIMDGLSDQQILDLHPEITQSDIDSAKRALLDTEE